MLPAPRSEVSFVARRSVQSLSMTIPDVGRCLGSGERPREGTEESDGSRTTGLCVACSGRFELDGDRVVDHETARDDERERRPDT
jgi:hypothetical protein